MIKKTCIGAAIASALAVQPMLAGAVDFNANVFYVKTVPMSGAGYGEWAKYLEKESKGALKAKVFYGGVLAPPKASLSAISDDLAQIGHIPAMYVPSQLPASNILHELSANFTDSLAMMGAITEYNFTNKDLQAQYKKVGVVYGGAYSTPEYRIFCRDKVASLDEMKGKKVRTIGAGSALLIEQLGGVPVNVPSSEMYSGLEKGILDCAANAISDLKARSLWDVAKHTTMMSLGIFYVGPQWGVNTKFWNKLDNDAKAALFKSFAYGMPLIYQEYMRGNEAAMTESSEHGETFHEPDAGMTKIIDAFRENNIARTVKLAKERKVTADPEKFVLDFVALYDQWVEALDGVDRNNTQAMADVFMEKIYSKVDPATYLK